MPASYEESRIPPVPPSLDAGSFLPDGGELSPSHFHRPAQTRLERSRRVMAVTPPASGH